MKKQRRSFDNYVIYLQIIAIDLIIISFHFLLFLFNLEKNHLTSIQKYIQIQGTEFVRFKTINKAKNHQNNLNVTFTAHLHHRRHPRIPLHKVELL
jgi:hypothetical protein